VWGDQAYRSQRAVIREHAPKARDFTNRRYRHRGVVDEVEGAKNRTKSKVRAKVEHPIGIIKRVFGFAKVRYRGLKKNAHRLLVTCALANLLWHVGIYCAAMCRNLSNVATNGCAAADRKTNRGTYSHHCHGCCNFNGGHPFTSSLFRPSLAVRVRFQKRRQRGPTVYALHALEVGCIGKGKARAPYEFGCKRCYGASGEHKASSSLETTDGVPDAAVE
jgi:Transposase DDE domain